MLSNKQWHPSDSCKFPKSIILTVLVTSGSLFGDSSVTAIGIHSLSPSRVVDILLAVMWSEERAGVRPEFI